MNKLITATNPSADPDYRGFTLREIRMRRAYIGVRLDMEKEEMALRSKSLATTARIPAFATKGIVGKILSKLDMVDLGVMAFTVGSRLWKISGRLRKRRKDK